MTMTVSDLGASLDIPNCGHMIHDAGNASLTLSHGVLKCAFRFIQQHNDAGEGASVSCCMQSDVIYGWYSRGWQDVCKLDNSACK